MFRTIFDRLGVYQSLATAHHPQSTGLAERYVQAVVTALRTTLVSSSEQWDGLLPFIAMAFNAAPQASTGLPPFMTDTGRSDATFVDLITPAVAHAAEGPQLAESMQHLARDALEHARLVRSIAIDAKRSASRLRVGDLVLVNQVALLTYEEKSRHVPKLRNRRVGPFRINRMLGGNAAELELPPHFRAHPVINVSHLTPYRHDPELHPDENTEPPLFKDASGEFYSVDSIVGHKKRAGKLVFVVKWKGYGHEHDSEVMPQDFNSGHHIHNYCHAKGLPVPPETPAA